MGKEAGSSSQPKRYPVFFHDIADHNLKDGTLEILPEFVKKHESHWPKYTCIEVPSGKMWKVELKSRGGRVLLDKGWQQFVEDCSIKSGYKLMLRYEGGSFFHAVIFDAGDSEIQYPCANQSVNLGQPKVTKIKEEDGNDDSSIEILDEDPLKSKDGTESNEEIETSESEGTKDDAERDEEVLEDTGLGVSSARDAKDDAERDEEVLEDTGLGVSSARDAALQRAFWTRHPHFIILMGSAYEFHLDVPESFGASYFNGRSGRDVYFKGPDDRAWPLKYSIGGPPHHQVAIDFGWSEFVQEYRLQDGDACLFELFSTIVMAFNVTIFRIAEGGEEEEEEGERSNILRMPDTPQPSHATRTQQPESASLERAGSLEGNSNKPSFTAVHKSGDRTLYAMTVPLAHASKYLMNQHNKQVFLHGVGGQTWPVKCYINGGHSVRLSTGWKGFVSDNELHEGDTCVFELVSQVPVHYNVTLIRAVAQSSKPRCSPRRLRTRSGN